VSEENREDQLDPNDEQDAELARRSMEIVITATIDYLRSAFGESVGMMAYLHVMETVIRMTVPEFSARWGEVAAELSFRWSNQQN
jgi:hypothetical protein